MWCQIGFEVKWLHLWRGTMLKKDQTACVWGQLNIVCGWFCHISQLLKFSMFHHCPLSKVQCWFNLISWYLIVLCPVKSFWWSLVGRLQNLNCWWPVPDLTWFNFLSSCYFIFFLHDWSSFSIRLRQLTSIVYITWPSWFQIHNL